MSTNTNTPTAAKTATPVPLDVSHMSSNKSKPETDEQESDSYQYAQDRECGGDEVFAVKGKGNRGFKVTCFECGRRGHEADRCWQNWKGKGRETGREEKMDPKERDGQKENGQNFVTRGTLLGIIPIGIIKAHGLQGDPCSISLFGQFELKLR